MSNEPDWSSVLNDHPIFSFPENSNGQKDHLELSLNTLPHFACVDPTQDEPLSSGKRQVMILKDADLILAAGREIRMTSLGDSKLNASTKRSYKTLHTPNIQFDIHHLELNPTNKLLAVAGAFHVAVVVLPRTGFTRLVSPIIDCKCVQVGQFYHGSSSSPPIAKIAWHPWGDAGSTLLVMTVDGKLREYDISLDTDEPQQVVSFVPERKSRSFLAEDVSEREVASFTFGKGQADWGPLTVYALMKSGDVYAVCPYMPKNSSIPPTYLHTLECFVSAKQEFLSEGTSEAVKKLSILYDYQRKYIAALLKQLPPAASRPTVMHPPTTIKSSPLRQGPFLLQPSPCNIEGSEGGHATDLIYLLFENGFEDDVKGDSECLGMIIIAFQDGKVDVCLDVEKVEAQWEQRQEKGHDLPMLAVYETIDLGLVSLLGQISVSYSDAPILNLLQGNYPSLVPDPIHNETVYVYHAFGVHSLHLGPMIKNLSAIFSEEEGELGRSLDTILDEACGTDVCSILNTFSIEKKCSNPVVAVSIPNDVYLTYGIFILTSAMRLASFPLTIQPDSPRLRSAKLSKDGQGTSKSLVPVDGPPGYVSLLGNEPFTPPPTRPLGLPSYPLLSLPSSQQSSGSEFTLTPDTLRYLGKIVECFTTQIHDVQLAHRATVLRLELQKQESLRQQDTCRDMVNLIEKLKHHDISQEKIIQLRKEQKVLLARLDRILRSQMKKASPSLSEHERKWFEELKGLKEEVCGAGRYDQGSLTARAAALEKEYNRILPDLKAMYEKEAEQKKKLSESNKGLGLTQAFKFGERSVIQRTRIRQIEKDILSLASKLDLSLQPPPSTAPSQSIV